jgi:hypothetical protein
MKQILGSILTKVFGTKINMNVIERVAGVLDEYKFTKEEIEASARDYESELTSRLEADMASDNWLAKSVRPIGFIVWTALLLFIIISDGNMGSFVIKDAYLPLIETVYVSYLGFYVGSRGVEKTIKLWKAKGK